MDKGCTHKPPKFLALGPGPLGVGAWLITNNKPLPTGVATSKFGSSASKGVRINRRVLRKLGSAGTPPLCGRGVDKDNPLEIRPLPTCVILSNLIVVGKTARALLMRSGWKSDPSRTAFQCHSRSSEPIRRLRLSINVPMAYLLPIPR